MLPDKDFSTKIFLWLYWLYYGPDLCQLNKWNLTIYFEASCKVGTVLLHTVVHVQIGFFAGIMIPILSRHLQELLSVDLWHIIDYYLLKRINEFL